jgi:hypothetical protein
LLYRDEYVPPGFTVVRRKGKPVDVNAGTTGERVFLCIKKGHGNPIRYMQYLLHFTQALIVSYELQHCAAVSLADLH